MQKDDTIYLKSFAREKNGYINTLLKKEDLLDAPTNSKGYIPATLKPIDEDEHGNNYIIYINTRELQK